MGVKVKERNRGEWWLYIDHNGKRKAKKVGSKKAAEEAAKKIQARLVLGDFDMGQKKEGQKTFRQCAELWLALPHFTRSGDPCKESTMDGYRCSLENHAYPVLGETPVDQIRRKQLKEFLDNLSISGVSRGTVATIKAPVNHVLSYAVDSELIESNPMKDLSISQGKRTLDIEPLTEEEAGRFLDAVKRFMGGYYYPHFLCMLRTGLRLGEAKAVQWQEVDFEKRQMEIRRSIRRGRVTDTKNRQRRRVDMTVHLTEMLQAWKTEQKKAALQRGTPFQETDYVFASKQGEVLGENAVLNALRRCLTAAKLRQIRIHDLRHSYATIRLLRGHNIGDVSYQLGHQSISFTYDVYGHWIPGHFKSEVDELDRPQPTATQAQPEPAIN
jgi:integrase